jgi:hypothetical protein
MVTRLHKITLSVLLAGSAALLIAAPAEANRGGTTTTTTGYVPPPPVILQDQIPAPSIDAPAVTPTVVPVDLPADPNAGLAGGGQQLAPAPGDDNVLGDTETNAKAEPQSGGFVGGILSRTGSESLPLARAGVGALALGLGLVILARRRRAEAASA